MKISSKCIECGVAFIGTFRPSRASSRPAMGKLCSRACSMRYMMRKRLANRKATFEARFWARVDRSGGPDACWPWTGSRDRFGYGRVRLQNGKYPISGRVALELSGRPAPAELLVCHHCDNPPCCNPAHLYAGTVKQNRHDQNLKGMPIAERARLRAEQGA